VTKNDIKRLFAGAPRERLEERKVVLTLRVPEEGISLSSQEGKSTPPEE
jgi:hypothetical protein